ncbi:MAG: SGNH/GDSL hydrolase family protein [Gammaproteobacteria bacterium]
MFTVVAVMKRVRVVYTFLMLMACALAPVSVLATTPDGDINTDGDVDVVDVLWGIQTLLGNRTLDATQRAHGDVAPLVSGVSDPDGLFNAGDVLLILRAAMGLLDLSYPVNQFNIGDSIGEGEAADGTIGEAHHETVWSTGYNGSDSFNTFNERFELVGSDDYYENNASRDPIFNHAVSGAQMKDFAGQAQAVITAAAQTPGGEAGQVTVFLGNNDVCAANMAEMTDPALFEAQYRTGLDVLAASDATRNARIHVSGIPAIYWLWNAKRNVFWCRVFAWPFVPCENLLDNAADDCASSASRTDPDNDYPGDGSNCQRRKTFHRLIRDTYNPILQTVVEEYRISGQLPNAGFTDIYAVRFESTHVNGGDCFHPSSTGHALISENEWCRTQWGIGDPSCPN